VKQFTDARNGREFRCGRNVVRFVRSYFLREFGSKEVLVDIGDRWEFIILRLNNLFGSEVVQ